MLSFPFIFVFCLLDHGFHNDFAALSSTNRHTVRAFLLSLSQPPLGPTKTSSSPPTPSPTRTLLLPEPLTTFTEINPSSLFTSVGNNHNYGSQNTHTIDHASRTHEHQTCIEGKSKNEKFSEGQIRVFKAIPLERNPIPSSLIRK